MLKHIQAVELGLCIVLLHSFTECAGTEQNEEQLVLYNKKISKVAGFEPRTLLNIRKPLRHNSFHGENLTIVMLNVA